MRITKRQLAEVLIDLELASYPRNVGNPIQEICPSFEAFIAYIGAYNGVRPLYTSINSYWDYVEGVPTLSLVSKMKMDMDTDKGQPLEKALEEMVELRDEHDKKNLDYRVTMTGNGFNFMPRYKPKFYSLDRVLKQYMFGIQQYFKNTLELKTLNLQCAEPRRLMEIPYTRYATDDKKGHILIHKNYRTPLLPEMLDWNLREILEYTHHPIHHKSYAPKGRRRHPTISEFVRELKIKPTSHMALPSGTVNTPINPDAKLFYEYTQLLIPIPCISESLFAKNPPHTIRFSACAFIRKIASKEFAHDFFDRLAEIAEWADRFNHGIRWDQVEDIYDGRYEPHGCEELLEGGFCSKVRYQRCKRASKIILPEEGEKGEETDSKPQ